MPFTGHWIHLLSWESLASDWCGLFSCPNKLGLPAGGQCQAPEHTGLSKQLAAMSRIWRDSLTGKTVKTIQVRALFFPPMRRCRQMKEQNPFYKTRAWKRKRAAILRRDGYQCQECRRYGRTTQAVTVHHIKELEEYPELALADDNLVSLCAQCHNKAHPEKAGSRRRYGS